MLKISFLKFTKLLVKNRLLRYRHLKGVGNVVNVAKNAKIQ